MTDERHFGALISFYIWYILNFSDSMLYVMIFCMFVKAEVCLCLFLIDFESIVSPPLLQVIETHHRRNSIESLYLPKMAFDLPLAVMETGRVFLHHFSLSAVLQHCVNVLHLNRPWTVTRGLWQITRRQSFGAVAELLATFSKLQQGVRWECITLALPGCCTICPLAQCSTQKLYLHQCLIYSVSKDQPPRDPENKLFYVVRPLG